MCRLDFRSFRVKRSKVKVAASGGIGLTVDGSPSSSIYSFYFIFFSHHIFRSAQSTFSKLCHMAYVALVLIFAIGYDFP